MVPPITPRPVPLAKRLFDLALTVPGLLLISPLLGVVALLLWISQGRPVLFGQLRGGHGGRVFKVYKFRTMREAFDEQGRPLPDEKRMTRLGQLLRATSIDELPELFNILRGEMSLIGPRPLMARYLERYSAEQMRRHEVLPGITGWAQINGRNGVAWEDRFRLDVWYVDHWSFWLDLKILALTFAKTIQREGISEPGQATMTEFMGSPSNTGEKAN